MEVQHGVAIHDVIEVTHQRERSVWQRESPIQPNVDKRNRIRPVVLDCLSEHAEPTHSWEGGVEQTRVVPTTVDLHVDTQTNVLRQDKVTSGFEAPGG